MATLRPDAEAQTRILLRRLTAVLPLFADELMADTPDERQALLSRVYFACVDERDRCKAPDDGRMHWAYSLPRHAALWCVYEDMRKHFMAMDCGVAA